MASCPTTTANVFTQNEKFISNVPSTYTVNQVTPSNITVRFGFTVPAPTAANATPTISDTTEDITTTGTVTFSNAVFDPGSTSVRRWNEIAMNANAIDHTFWWESDQLGPARTSRAFAIVHIAIFDAVNAIAGGYQGYTRLKPAHAGTSMDAAIAQAAHDTLVALFPSQKAGFDGWLAEDLGNIPNGSPKAHGIALGKRAAKAILELRNADGSQVPDPPVCTDGSTVDCFQTSAAPGKWRQDPISKFPLALGA